MSHAFSDRPASPRRARHRRPRRPASNRPKLLVELLEDRTAPAILDLFTAAASGTVNGARFEEVVATSSTGTGVFDSFVRLQASNNDFDRNGDTEQGVNYDRAGGLTKQYDELTDPNSNRKLLLSEVPIVTVAGADYREFFLDINQLNNKPYLSLDMLIVSVGNAGNLQQIAPSSYDPTFGGNAILAYNMDVGPNGDSTVRMLSNSILDNGSGKGDVRLLIPVANFVNSYATPYVYLFSKFGFSPPANVDGQPGNEEFYANDGFEEWAVKPPAGVVLPRINIVKVTTYNGTEVDGQSIPEGAAIGWKYTVTNTGNVPLSSITVTDSVAGITPQYQSGDGGVIDVLEVGESWIYTASGTAQSAHLGTYTNLGTTTGVYQTTTVTATDPSSYTPTDVAPSLTITKTPTPGSVPEGAAASVSYSFTVTNTSNSQDPVTVTSLTDTHLGNLLPAFITAHGSATLAPGASRTFSVTGTVLSQNAYTSFGNTVTVVGADDDAGGTDATASASATVTYTDVVPSIDITKSVDHPYLPAPGGMVTYTFTVRNTSNSQDPVTITSLSDTTLDNLLPAFLTANGGSYVLAPGVSKTFTVTATLPTLSAGQTHSNTVTVMAHDDDGPRVAEISDSATATVTIIEPGLFTNTEYCDFDYDPARGGNQFRNIFIMDAPGVYRLNGTNPGQFYYNVFVPGSPGTAVNVQLNIPYPFVTHGAVPIHVYNNFAIGTNAYGYCLTPLGDVTGAFTIDTEGGTLSPSGKETIRLGDYSVPGDMSESITVSGTIPSTGWMYVTVHLENGLKGTTGWQRDILAGPSYDSAMNSALGVTLGQPQSYNFTFVPNGGPVTYTETGQSVNVYKRESGVMGMVTTASTGGPRQGARVQLWSPSSTLIATETTDEDGYYLIRHEHRGSPANYTIKLLRANGSVYQTQVARLRSNGYHIGNFTPGADYLQLLTEEADAAGGTASVTLLTEGRLAEAVTQAFAYWQAQGVAADQLQAVQRQLDARVVDLTGSLLGQATEEFTRIEIDIDAAGYGWDRVDLLRVVTHEVGHLFGFEDDDPDHRVMGGTLEAGVRLLPDLGGDEGLPTLGVPEDRAGDARRSAVDRAAMDLVFAGVVEGMRVGWPASVMLPDGNKKWALGLPSRKVPLGGWDAALALRGMPLPPAPGGDDWRSGLKAEVADVLVEEADAQLVFARRVRIA